MSWVRSRETSDALVKKEDIEREPQLYPKEVVEALGRIAAMEARDFGSTMKPEFRFAFKGYIISDMEPVCIRPDASDFAKKEWMNYWEACKAMPYAII